VATPKPQNQAAEVASHPIAWFSALLRGVDRGDSALIDASLIGLKQLGNTVNIDQVAHDADRRQAVGS
jgi:hypothetical protein